MQDIKCRHVIDGSANDGFLAGVTQLKGRGLYLDEIDHNESYIKIRV